MYLKQWTIQVVKQVIILIPLKIIRFFKFISDWIKFNRLNKGNVVSRIRDWYPCLSDNLKSTGFDHHYIYHPAWAARILSVTKPARHIDISSILSFSTMLSAFIPVQFYDYRPAHLELSNLSSGFADLLHLPFENNSISSLSCMHTVEHIGLGRYGDPLDPRGDVKAIDELIRVLGVNGDLLFVTPVGKPKIEFNAHRIYSFEQIISHFSNLKLKEFSLILDNGQFINDADPALVKSQQYACGCFWFKKSL